MSDRAESERGSYFNPHNSSFIPAAQRPAVGFIDWLGVAVFPLVRAAHQKNKPV
jgi:hypothetical protein